MHASKEGRPRLYDLRPAEGFAHPDVAYTVTALDEALERVVDQVDDLTLEQLRTVPEQTGLSIAMLLVHLAWAEAGWITRITGARVSEELDRLLQPAGRAVPAGEILVPELSRAELIDLCLRVRAEFTYPALQTLTAIDAPAEDNRRGMTARGVLLHLVWHWIYHSGHIGLLRDLVGAGYTWRFHREEPPSTSAPL